MKSIISLGAILAALFQLISYQITKYRYKGMHVTDGVVMHSKLDNYNDVDGKRVFQANIEIEYQFNGSRYLSKFPVLRSFEISPSHNFENDLVAKCKVGESIKVRFNKSNPSKGYIAIAPLSVVSTIGVTLAALLGVAYLCYVTEVLSNFV